MLGPLRILAFWVYGRLTINMTLKFDEIFERLLKRDYPNPSQSYLTSKSHFCVFSYFLISFRLLIN